MTASIKKNTGNFNGMTFFSLENFLFFLLKFSFTLLPSAFTSFLFLEISFTHLFFSPRQARCSARWVGWRSRGSCLAPSCRTPSTPSPSTPPPVAPSSGWRQRYSASPLPSFCELQDICKGRAGILVTVWTPKPACEKIYGLSRKLRAPQNVLFLFLVRQTFQSSTQVTGVTTMKLFQSLWMHFVSSLWQENWQFVFVFPFRVLIIGKWNQRTAEKIRARFTFAEYIFVLFPLIVEIQICENICVVGYLRSIFASAAYTSARCGITPGETPRAAICEFCTRWDRFHSHSIFEFTCIYA